MLYLLLWMVGIGISFAADNHFQFTEIPYNGTTICISTDYYKENGIRMPVGMDKALSIAKEHNAKIVTKELVDHIWNIADLKLKPMPLPNKGKNIAQFSHHNSLIENQITGPFKILAGHKKDIVVPIKKTRVVIYGWHRENGKVIQNLYDGHYWNYVDYSHGLRLHKPNCERADLFVNGTWIPFE